jgi:hypothetical protein
MDKDNHKSDTFMTKTYTNQDIFNKIGELQKDILDNQCVNNNEHLDIMTKFDTTKGRVKMNRKMIYSLTSFVIIFLGWFVMHLPKE